MYVFFIDTLRSCLLRKNLIEIVPKLVSIDWKVNYVMCNDEEEVNAPSVQLKIGVEDENKTDSHAFELDQDKFNVFLGGLFFLKRDDYE